MHAGDAFVFNPFEVHMGGNPQHPVEYEVLYPSWRFVSDCCPPADRKFALPVVRTDVLRRCDATEALIDALSEKTGGAASVDTALRKFMQSCSFEPDGIPAIGVTAVRAACQLIDERYMSPLRTDALAGHVGLHKSHFVRIFHRVTGIAPQNYLRQVRVARARGQICAGAELSEAAQLAGFCDQAHLTREFRKVYGVTPGRLMRDVRTTLDKGRHRVGSCRSQIGDHANPVQ